MTMILVAFVMVAVVLAYVLWADDQVRRSLLRVTTPEGGMSKVDVNWGDGSPETLTSMGVPEHIYWHDTRISGDIADLGGMLTEIHPLSHLCSIQMPSDKPLSLSDRTPMTSDAVLPSLIDQGFSVEPADDFQHLTNLEYVREYKS